MVGALIARKGAFIAIGSDKNCDRKLKVTCDDLNRAFPRIHKLAEIITHRRLVTLSSIVSVYGFTTIDKPRASRVFNIRTAI